jgi:hypothetical protein
MPITKQTISLINNLPDEAKQKLKLKLEERLIAEGKMDTPSSMEKLKFGFKRAKNLTQNIFDISQQNSLQDEYSRQARSSHLEKLTAGIENKALKDLSMSVLSSPGSFTGALMQPTARFPMEAQKQAEADQYKEAVRQKQQYQHEQMLQKEFANIYGTRWQDSWEATLGGFGKVVADPSTALPVGSAATSIYKIALASGSLAAFDQSVFDLARSGQIDPESSAVAFGLGAIAGPLLIKGGYHFTKWITGKMRDGVPVTAEDMSRQLEKYDIKDADPKALAETVNSKLNLNNKGSTALVPKSKTASTELVPELNTIQQQALPPPAKRLPAPSETSQKALTYESVKEFKQLEDFLANYSKNAKTIRALSDAGTAEEQALQRTKLLKDIELQEVGRVEAPEVPAVLRPKKELPALPSPEMFDKASRLIDKEDEAAVAFLKQQAGGDPTRSPGASTDLPLIFKNQAGNISNNLLAHMGAAGLGAAVGYKMDGPEGAIVGAAIGLGLPWTAGKTYKVLGKTSQYLKKNLHEFSEAVAKDNYWGYKIASPQRQLRAFGNVGEVIAKKLDQAEMDVQKLGTTMMLPISKRLRTFSKEELANFSRVMQGITKPISKKVADLRAITKAQFDHILNHAVRRGMMSSNQAAAFSKKPYWPRVYNDPYLATKEGKSLWVDTLTSQQFDKLDAENILEHITHGKVGELGDFFSFKNGKYIMTRDAALKLLSKRKNVAPKQRSHHLEKRRVLFPKNEQLLNPFLLDDPTVVLTEYFHDVAKRFAYADEFGANDEIFNSLANTLKNQHGAHAFDVASHTYYSSVGDSRGMAIAKQLAISESSRQILGSINAFETLKLSLSQIPNVTQATVFGLTQLAKYNKNPLSLLNAYRKGIQGLFRKEGKFSRDAALRSAAAYEATVLQVLGEGSLNHKIINSLPSVFDPINDPSSFLRSVGFVKAEQWQRILAANMGRAHFESVMNRKAMIEAGEIGGKDLAKQQAWVKKALDELGLDSNKSVGEFTEGDALQAMHKFSNIVNFTNDMSKLPLAWRGPYGRLFTKFKSFAFNAGKFIKDNVVKEALDGNFMPLVTYLTVSTPLGMGVDELRRTITADDREFTMTERVLRGMIAVGGIGIAMDIFSGLASDNPGRAVGALLGPAAGDATNLARSTVQATESKSVKPIARAAVQMVGGFPLKQKLLDELRVIHKAKKRGRNASRSSGRSASRGGR